MGRVKIASHRLILLVTANLFLGAVPLRAVTYDTYSMTETNGSFCGVVGGACVGDRDFDAGFFKNPAAFSAGSPNFDFDFDVDLDQTHNREPGLTGIEAYGSRQVMGALAFSTNMFGLGLSYVATDSRWQGPQSQARLINHVAHVPVSGRLSGEWQIGIDSSLIWNELAENNQAYHTGLGFGLGVGVLFQGPRTTWGGRVDLPTRVRSVGRAGAQSETFVSPAALAIGASRNLRVGLVGLAEVEVIGTSPGARLFSGREDAPCKGGTLKFAPRIGARQMLTSHVTGFGGAFLEVARTAGAADRAHLTLGVSYKVPLTLEWWDVAEFMAGVDLARGYERVFLTFR